jgi:cell division protease FtsH
LTRHRAALDALVKALLDRESLDEREILQVTGLPPAPPLESKKLSEQSNGVATSSGA